MGSLLDPLPELFLLIWLQLFLMHDLPNGLVRFMHGVPTLICAGRGCASNHMQDHFLKPQSTDSHVLSTILSVNIEKTVSQLLTDGYKCVWCRCC